MKNKRLKTMLLAEGAACALLAFVLRLIAGAAFSVSGLPGSAVGQGLTTLASAGRFGFALALTLYAFLVLLPLYALVRIREKRALRGEDALLALISLAAACTLFPRGAAVYWSADMAALIPRLAWQWLIPALLAGWVVLRLLRRFLDGDTQELLKLFRALLILAAAYFVFEVCFAEFAGLFSDIDTLRAGNTALTDDTPFLAAYGEIAESKSLAASYLILALRFGAEALPSLLAAATAYFAVGLLDTMDAGAFTQESARQARALSAWCARALRVSMLTTLAVDLVQALSVQFLLNTLISIPLPLFELCFVLAALLGARLIESNVTLAADNELFI